MNRPLDMDMGGMFGGMGGGMPPGVAALMPPPGAMAGGMG